MKGTPNLSLLRFVFRGGSVGPPFRFTCRLLPFATHPLRRTLGIVRMGRAWITLRLRCGVTLRHRSSSA